jgi:hypothetical protein
VEQVMDCRPSEHGYQAEGWTTALIATIYKPRRVLR